MGKIVTRREQREIRRAERLVTEEAYSLEDRIAYQRFGEVENLKKIQAQLVEDLEKALNFVVAYQRCLRILRSPDPNFVDARRLLSKYKMVGIEPAGGYKIYADGVDITLHTDSIEATVIEDAGGNVHLLDLPEDDEWKDDQGTERAELVTDENGVLRLCPVETEGSDDVSDS